MTDREPDYLTQHGAIEIARRLRAYWLDRGYNIATKVEAVTSRGRVEIWAVRSNLVGGRPPESSKVLAMDEAA